MKLCSSDKSPRVAVKVRLKSLFGNGLEGMYQLEVLNVKVGSFAAEHFFGGFF